MNLSDTRGFFLTSTWGMVPDRVSMSRTPADLPYDREVDMIDGSKPWSPDACNQQTRLHFDLGTRDPQVSCCRRTNCA